MVSFQYSFIHFKLSVFVDFQENLEGYCCHYKVFANSITFIIALLLLKSYCRISTYIFPYFWKYIPAKIELFHIYFLKIHSMIMRNYFQNDSLYFHSAYLSCLYSTLQSSLLLTQVYFVLLFLFLNSFLVSFYKN